MTPADGPTIFVIDDDAAMRASIQGLLKSVGLRSETFGTAQEFLRIKRPDGPSCLILDVRLPGVNGLDFQRELADGGFRIPIIFITGHGDIPMSVQAIKRGAVDFLPKPFGDEALLNAVAQALSRSTESWGKRDEVAQFRARIATLTPRELEVFRLVIAGLLNKQIASELGAALRTIKTHRGRVMHKLGVESVAELARLAQTAGIAPAQLGT